ncbi:ion transporter [Stutzerimonas stutzeri]|uniref:Ion transporter n=1 Tax=Stutzerimonas stutzeri TaxID=316 RepID=A0A2N8T2F6_STUST|nr:ion transporter [Stutzerimonas stutzeri]MCQ4326677.1 ion transporter [Stutzerimonas stutzeri]PNG08918.1 ion transporter [Stutzerimonas stutzeri]
MQQRPVTPFQIFILVLSIYVIGALLADLFFALPADVSALLGYLDNIVCFFFFLDFWMRLQRAENKLQFMRWGWIDLLASVPAGGLQAAKLFRAFQILRVLRAIKSLQLIWRILFRNRAEGIVASAATATMLLVAFGAITMLLVEAPNPESSINTPEEALWWAFVTVTTVGYGDFYPVTSLGRIVAVMLMVSGVGLFGSFAAYIGSLFVADKSEEDSREQQADREVMNRLLVQVESLTREVQSLRAQLHDTPALRDREQEPH